MRQIKANQPKVAELLWQEQGPENIGGRTRAIIVDQMNENHIYAASVSGGLFESWNKGNTWNSVWKWDAFMFITSLCQTSDGTVFVGTGDSQDFAEYSFVGGRGVWYQPQGTDEWFQVPGSAGSNVGELVSSGSQIILFIIVVLGSVCTSGRLVTLQQLLGAAARLANKWILF
jgi:hypothetical protein